MSQLEIKPAPKNCPECGKKRISKKISIEEKKVIENLLDKLQSDKVLLIDANLVNECKDALNAAIKFMESYESYFNKHVKDVGEFEMNCSCGYNWPS